MQMKTKWTRKLNHLFPLVDCTVGVASRSQARHAQISRFLLVLGPEEVLALSKDTIGTAWASRLQVKVGYVIIMFDTIKK